MFISLDIITWNKYVHFSNFHLLSSLQWIFFVHVGKNKQQTLEYYEWLKICFIATLLPIKDNSYYSWVNFAPDNLLCCQSQAEIVVDIPVLKI